MASLDLPLFPDDGTTVTVDTADIVLVAPQGILTTVRMLDGTRYTLRPPPVVVNIAIQQAEAGEPVTVFSRGPAPTPTDPAAPPPPLTRPTG